MREKQLVESFFLRFFGYLVFLFFGFSAFWLFWLLSPMINYRFSIRIFLFFTWRRLISLSNIGIFFFLLVALWKKLSCIFSVKIFKSSSSLMMHMDQVINYRWNFFFFFAFFTLLTLLISSHHIDVDDDAILIPNSIFFNEKKNVKIPKKLSLDTIPAHTL